jgi:hypothetical protein
MSHAYSHEEIQELLGAFALDAVDGDERRLVSDHLADCPRCRAEVAEHREVAALLAHSGAPAPEGLWDRIAGSLEEPPPRLRLAPVPDDGPGGGGPAPPAPGDELAARRRPLGARVAVGLGAAAAVVIGLLSYQLVEQDRRLDEMAARLSEDGLVRAFNATLVSPQATITELRSEDGGLVVTVAVGSDGIGFLTGDQLPPLAEGRAYQLWGIVDEDRIVSLGVLGEAPEVVVFHAATPMAGFAVTEEIAGGVPVSQNPPLVVGTLD